MVSQILRKAKIVRTKEGYRHVYENQTLTKFISSRTIRLSA